MPTKHPDFHRRMMALADGGHVRGPGSGTSDSIPARLSDGEFVLPADTVRKVGVKSLRDLVNVTHQPSGRPTHPARFADGGLVSFGSNKRERAGSKLGAIAADQDVATAPLQGAYAPGTRGAQLVAAEQQKAKDRAATGTAIVDAIKAPFGKGSSPATPSLNAPVNQQPTALNPTDQRLASGLQASPAVTGTGVLARLPVPAAVTVSAQPPQPKNSFDFDTFKPAPGEGAFRNEQTGEVTRLQSTPGGTQIWKPQQQAPAAPTGLVPAGRRQEVRAPVLNPNGGVFSSMVDFTNQAGQAMQAIAANKGMRNDRKDALDQQRVGLDAASTLAKIDQGYQSLGIDGRRADTADRLAGVQEGEFGLKRETTGFQSRIAARMEKAQIDLENAKTPDEQRSARERLLALAGKAPQNEWGLQVTPTTKNLDGSTTQGSVWRYNKMTGETALVDGKSSAVADVPSSKDALVKGQVYQTARGPARWDGGQFQPMR
ncbi:MAG: hypothetical protein KJZ76_14785 [Burkholderiaceae bacterium]|nr:hypothetical protein [Burkholderiaceae bacterium]